VNGLLVGGKMGKKMKEEKVVDTNAALKTAAQAFLSISKDKFKDLSKYGSTMASSIYGEIPEYIDTGSYALNRLITGSIFGGLPAGRVVSFAGDSSTGKSFSIGLAIRDAQKKGYLVIYYDSENAATKNFMENIGVDTESMIYFPIDEISDLKNHVIHTVTELKKQLPDQKVFIALDSLGNMSCAQEKGFIEKKSDSVTQGGREREVKSMLKELTKFCGKYHIPFVFTNHVMKPQDTGMMPQYVKNVQGGGKQAQYMASAVIMMTRKKLKAEDALGNDGKGAEDDKKKVGNILTCESDKNRLCPEGERIEIYLSFRTGLNRYYGLADDAVKAGCFQKKNENNYIVNGKQVHVSKLYTKEVFTEEVLKQIDEYCKATYRYSSVQHNEDLDEIGTDAEIVND
jgi:RecA/RadA recombinase